MLDRIHMQMEVSPVLYRWYFDRYWSLSVLLSVPLLLRTMLHYVPLDKL